MRIPPFPSGHGGSQRAWLLVNALAKLGAVHFVLVHRPSDRDLDSVSLKPLMGVVESVIVLPIPTWDSFKHKLPWLPWRIACWLDQFIKGSAEAPRLSPKVLAEIAKKLPGNRFETVFAGRLPSAVIVDQLIGAGLLHCKNKVADFDDIMSRFIKRQLNATPNSLVNTLLQWREVRLVEKAERAIATWDAVSLCSDIDVKEMSAALPLGHFVKVPNVVDRPLLPPPDGTANILFVGNLSFPPNEHGLRRFVIEIWPRVISARPDARLDVVGLRPSVQLRALLNKCQIALHANVSSVEPFYRRCAIVVCPIFFGGGTRIKLLEAMAYGRPIVSTTIGVEGLGIKSHQQAIIADDIGDFAEAIIRLLNDTTLAAELAADARLLQQLQFVPEVINVAVTQMIGGPQNRTGTG
jgi:glycosyltransferase involved in cell wall biosynthesis